MFNFIFWGLLSFVYFIILILIIFVIDKYIKFYFYERSSWIQILVIIIPLILGFVTKNYIYSEYSIVKDFIFGTQADYCPSELQGIQTINENYEISGCP